jgi:hypothetical protein
MQQMQILNAEMFKAAIDKINESNRPNYATNILPRPTGGMPNSNQGFAGNKRPQQPAPYRTMPYAGNPYQMD